MSAGSDAPTRGAAPRSVAVVGGGWAGVAAAVEAARHGWRVTLLEMAPALGGRARSVEQVGLQLDNGQHILIGAYVETLALMTFLGLDLDRLLLRTPLRLVDERGGGLRMGRGHPVIAFAVAAMRRTGWTLRERLALLRAASRWARGGFRCDPASTVAQLCRGLPPGVRHDLIDPLCVAALNTPSDEASAEVFLRVLRDALFSAPGSADLVLPRVALGALLPAAGQRWLAQAGARVFTGTRVMQLAPEAGGWRVDAFRYDAVLLACSPIEAARLVRPIDAAWADTATALDYEPIATVYLRAVGVRLREPMVSLDSDDDLRPAQFVFDLGRLRGETGLLAFVVSGAARWVERGVDALETAVIEQARGLAAIGDRVRLVTLRTLVEKRATFRCTPQLRRPPAVIAPGLWAAGDHVEGPYPSTLEGAVRSGLAAARALGTANLDHPR